MTIIGLTSVHPIQRVAARLAELSELRKSFMRQPEKAAPAKKAAE